MRLTRLLPATLLSVCLLLAAAAHSWAQSSTPATLHSGATATADGTVMSVPYFSTVGVQLTGTFTATLVPKVSQDGTTWDTIRCTNTATGGSVSSMTATGSFQCPTAGFRFFSLPVTAYTDGTVIAKAEGTVGVSGSGGSSGGGGTQYQEDSAHVSGDTGTMSLCVRRDANTTLADTTGDYAPCQVDANGSLKVAIISGAGSGGTAMTDDAAFTPGTTSITPAGAMFDDVAPDSVNEGDGGVLRMSANRNLYTTLRDAAGNERGANINASNELLVALSSVPSHAVTNAGTFATQAAQSGTWTMQPGNTANTTPWLMTINQGGNAAAVNGSGQLSVTCANCSGSGASAVDDAAFTPASGSGAPAMGFFDDVSPDSVNEGDAGVLRMSANRNLYTTLRDAAGNERGANINASNELLTNANTELPAAVQSTTTGQTAPTAPFVNAYIHCQDASATTISPCVASANIAHDAVATSANPLLIGGYASAAAPTDVSADGDAVRAWYLRNGARATQQTFAGVLASAGAGNTGTGVQRVIEATDSQLSAGVGATGDAAATAGSTGSLNAKLRLLTTDVDAIKTAVQLIDDDQTGASMHHRVSAGSTEDEHEIKGSAGRLFSINVTNTNAAVRYLRCANQVAASTTPGTTTVWYGMAIPGATTGAGYTANFGPSGAAFSTGLTCWLVTGAAETDVAEVAANEINVNYTYK